MNSFLKKCLFVMLLVLAQAAFALVEIPSLQTRVTDLTGTLSSAEKSNLEAKLKAFEAAKGAQIAVLIVPSTKPEALEQYSIRVADAWKIGRKSVGDGVIVIVAKDDRKMRIEVGRGLEGAIPDIYAKRIVRDEISPYFKHRDYAGGLNAGVDSLIKLIDGEALPAPTKQTSNANPPLGMLLFIGLFGAMILPAIFGRFFGSTANAGLVGGAATLMGIALPMAGIFGLVAFIFAMMGAFESVRGGRGINGYSTGGYGGGWSSGGGGAGWSSNDSWSGGGGDFGGGGASGDW